MSTTDTAQLRHLLESVARHDREAFRRLYELTAPKLFSFALRILRKHETAEEVLQETFVNIWNHAGTYQPGMAAPMTWMTTILRNKAFDLLRRADPVAEAVHASSGEDGMDDLLESLESSERLPQDALQLSENAAALALCLKRLEGLHRQAIVMAFYHDLSHSEVASQLRLPIGTVKTWIRRGLERLRLCLAGSARP